MSTILTTSQSGFLNATPRLPLELVHLILRNLSPSLDKPTLSSCALVHTSWSTFSRRLLFQCIQLDALTMPQHAHPEFTHINMPDFSGFLMFMRDNPLLAHSVQQMEISGFVRSCWKDPARYNTGMEDMWAWMELDVYDEFVWEWDWDAKKLKGMPSSCRWTKLPRELLHALVATPRLFPKLEGLALNSLFVEYGSEDVRLLADIPELPLKELVLCEVGTTANSNRALLQFLNLFNSTHITIDTFPTPDSDPSTAIPTAYTQELASIIGFKRTTSLEIAGNPDASFTMELLKAAPAFSNNLTKLELHIRDTCEVASLSSLLKTIGRNLKKLSIDLRPVCYVSKPEVHMDHSTYVAFMRNFTLFPCTSLTHFKLSFSISFDYSGASNALDCTPQLLTTLSPSVSHITLFINFPFVVQAAAINLNWNDVHFALVRMGSGSRGVRGLGGKGMGVRDVRIVVANEGVKVNVEERENVEILFKEKFYMIKDILRVEFEP
ncbi:hypothetical protein BDY19DRAFT_988139 [Irpex rosettiformis]|uniref:Uncharacterized protein n=1 Tax=Irpex rosettiformis TaxID=378272 RepID=A0ACB8UIW7_9APHY|nr:hypothetical protein BDY19DRAFT_988139 [Irpex rosettiformis]